MDTKSTIKLIKNYSRESHLRLLEQNISADCTRLETLQPIFSEEWNISKASIPYIAKTHLLDSYYCLPQRPDMAFTHLWKAINNSYNNYYLKQVYGNNNCKSLSDSKSLSKVIEHIADSVNNSFEYQSKHFTIDDIVQKYCVNISLKSLRFVASYILKGIAIDSSHVSEIYASSSYKSFKSRFPHNFDVINNTYGNKYKIICSPAVSSDKTSVDYNISDREKSRALVHSLAQSFKELLENGIVHLDNKTTNFSGGMRFLSTKEKLEFLIFSVLYAVRNNNIHGNVASRMNSNFVNQESFKAAEYIYLLGHMFLSLIMYRNGDLKITDLYINLENI